LRTATIAHRKKIAEKRPNTCYLEEGESPLKNVVYQRCGGKGFLAARTWGIPVYDISAFRAGMVLRAGFAGAQDDIGNNGGSDCVPQRLRTARR
jgi:hypothetical protein